MSDDTLGLLIDGRWRSALSGQTAVALSPATGEQIATVAIGGRDDVRAAIAAARAAAERWAAVSAFERAARMHAVADVIQSRREQLARTLTLDQGKPLHAEAYAEVDELIQYWRMAAEDAKRLGGELANSLQASSRALLLRRPRGVIGVITPWNWPYTMPAELIAPALACGNTAVWVPAPSTSVCAVQLARAIADAELPPGVLNLICGPGPVVGDELARNPGTDGIAFIGSTATGRQVAAAAAGKALVLEMGGNGPLVVLEDADLEAAVQGALTACFLCAGQSCTAGERLLVHSSVVERFAAALTAAVRERVVLGDPFAPDTTMGPLNNEAVAAKMDAHVADAIAAGARPLCGGRRADGFPTALYWQPTVLADVPPSSLVAREETFGPVAPIVTIDSLEQAIALANDSPYGLLASIYTADLQRGLEFAERVRSGWVNINESTNYWEPQLPFGGRSGSASGIGRVGGAHVMHAFTEPQTIVISPGRRGA
jgi:acyl-CoA reductase-like NAD-dependent aldehyde dehydrogenase